MNSANSTYTLFRPRGGLNDVLCELERCWSYSENFGRKLLVDTRYGCFFDDFWRYFQPRDSSFVGRIEDYRALDLMTCFPDCLEGRLASWVGEWDSVRKFIEPRSGLPLTFDFTRAYPQQAVIHAQPWTGPLMSVKAWRRLILSKEVRDAINSRIVLLPDRYVAIHIRNTDYQSRYQEFLWRLRSKLSGENVVICSDDYKVFGWLRDNISANFIRISRFPENKGVPLHYISDESTQSQFDRNIDMLTDLACMVKANDLICVPIANGRRLSGFSLLAIGLRECLETFPDICGPL